MTSIQKLLLALGGLLAPILSWFAGKYFGGKEMAKKTTLEQKADQVEVLKTDVAIDRAATEKIQEIRARPADPPTVESMKAFIGRVQKGDK